VGSFTGDFEGTLEFRAKEAQQFGILKRVPVQRLLVGQLDRTQRGEGRGKGALGMGQPSLCELF